MLQSPPPGKNIADRRLETRWPKSPHPHSFLYTPASSALRGEKEFQRQVDFIEEAEKVGEIIYRGDVDAGRRRMGVTLVKMPPNGTKAGGVKFLEEEIFGPVLPIIPVRVSIARLPITPSAV